jgi:hypothetical protein
MEYFPPESMENAEKKQKQKFSHKKPTGHMARQFANDKKQQAAEIIYLKRYE